VHVADSALASLGELLTSIQGHIVEAAGATTDEEMAAHQIEIDAAVQAIDRIGGSTAFAGQPLLSRSISLPASPPRLPEETLANAKVAGFARSVEVCSVNTPPESGGSASLQHGDFETAMAIVGQARSSVLESRAQAGAFERSSIEAMQRVWGSIEENLSSALSEIRDTDVAAETSLMVRAEILSDAALSSLQWIGQRRSGVLSLLSGGGL
jgi:flagellin